MVACFFGGLAVCFSVLCSAACCVLGIEDFRALKSEYNAQDAPVGYFEISDSELSDNELDVETFNLDNFQVFPGNHIHSN